MIRFATAVSLLGLNLFAAPTLVADPPSGFLGIPIGSVCTGKSRFGNPIQEKIVTVNGILALDHSYGTMGATQADNHDPAPHIITTVGGQPEIETAHGAFYRFAPKGPSVVHVDVHYRLRNSPDSFDLVCGRP